VSEQERQNEASGAQPETAVAPERVVFAGEAAEHAPGRLELPDGYAAIEGAPGGEGRAVAVLVGRFNGEITSGLLRSALVALEEAGVERDAITIVPVPGAFELPLAAMALARTRRYACTVALGCIIRGETPHFDFVAAEAASGLQLAGIETGVPVAFGVLTCETREQALARVERGAEAARTALEMADLFAQLRGNAALRPPANRAAAT
jgi:6,7-dimethyl-8-ribityllumazine synthase